LRITNHRKRDGSYGSESISLPALTNCQANKIKIATDESADFGEVAAAVDLICCQQLAMLVRT